MLRFGPLVRSTRLPRSWVGPRSFMGQRNLGVVKSSGTLFPSVEQIHSTWERYENGHLPDPSVAMLQTPAAYMGKVLHLHP